MKKNSDNFGKTLRELRRSGNLTQETFSHIIETDRSNVANYENGKRLPTIETLIKIASFFNVSLDYLVFGSNGSNGSESSNLDKMKNELMAENTMLMENQIKLQEELFKKDEDIKMLREMVDILKRYNKVLESKFNS